MKKLNKMILIVVLLLSFVGCIGYNETIADVFEDGIYNCSINQETSSEIYINYSTDFFKIYCFTKNSKNFTEDILIQLKQKVFKPNTELLIYVEDGRVWKIIDDN